MRKIVDGQIIDTWLGTVTPVELRSYPGEVKLAADGNRIEGYAIVYDAPSVMMKFPGTGEFREIIRPGAATDALKSADVRALYEHQRTALLGRTSAGTLNLREDAAGVAYSIAIPDTTLGRDVREMVKRRDIRGASFYLDVPKGGDVWTRQPDGTKVRSIHKLNLSEISLVSTPAYPDTTAALRSFEEFAKANAGIPLAVRLAQVRLARMS